MGLGVVVKIREKIIMLAISPLAIARGLSYPSDQYHQPRSSLNTISSKNASSMLEYPNMLMFYTIHNSGMKEVRELDSRIRVAIGLRSGWEIPQVKNSR